MRVTINNINKALVEAGLQCEIVKGDGYFWFDGPAVEQCHSTSVATCHLTAYSVDQWVAEAANLASESSRSIDMMSDMKFHSLTASVLL